MTVSDLRIEQLPTLRDLVQDRMRAAIVSGRFASGERLVERTLCDQLGVSRTVVREVIRYLEAEGAGGDRAGQRAGGGAAGLGSGTADL